MSNDAVSRDGVKNLLTRIRDEIDEGYGFNYQEAVEELMGMPSTQPQLEQSTHSEQGKSDELGVKSGKTCTDTISRQAAITAIQKAYTDTEGGTDKCAVWKNVGLTNALHIMQDLPPAQPERCSDCIVHGGDWECDHMHCRKGRLPSAQPERTEERTKTHSCDLISRQAAIDKFEPWLKVDGYSEGELNMLKAVLYELRFLPSAQPEIIHCGDCRYWKNDHLCECLSRYGTFETEIYFYCGFAERREE